MQELFLQVLSAEDSFAPGRGLLVCLLMLCFHVEIAIQKGRQDDIKDFQYMRKVCVAGSSVDEVGDVGTSYT